jgi:hypothetical protein
MTCVCVGPVSAVKKIRVEVISAQAFLFIRNMHGSWVLMLPYLLLGVTSLAISKDFDLDVGSTTAVLPSMTAVASIPELTASPQPTTMGDVELMTEIAATETFPEPTDTAEPEPTTTATIKRTILGISSNIPEDSEINEPEGGFGSLSIDPELLPTNDGSEDTLGDAAPTENANVQVTGTMDLGPANTQIPLPNDGLRVDANAEATTELGLNNVGNPGATNPDLPQVVRTDVQGDDVVILPAFPNALPGRPQGGSNPTPSRTTNNGDQGDFSPPPISRSPPGYAFLSSNNVAQTVLLFGVVGIVCVGIFVLNYDRLKSKFSPAPVVSDQNSSWSDVESPTLTIPTALIPRIPRIEFDEESIGSSVDLDSVVQIAQKLMTLSRNESDEDFDPFRPSLDEAEVESLATSVSEFIHEYPVNDE